MINKNIIKLNVFDIETFVNDDNILQPYCICYLYNDEEFNFYGIDCIENFIDFLCKIKKKNIFYAHNLTFDGSFLLNSFKKKKIKFDIVIFNNSIYNIKVHNTSIKCSYKLFPYSLSKANKILNIGIEKINFNHSLANNKSILDNNFKEETIKYCKNDVIIVKKILDIYNKSLFNICNTWYEKNSISSITLYLFNKLYNNYKVKTKLPVFWDEIFRKSYFGGRCEILGNPKKKEYIYHFDFKGMYAQIMLEDYPIGDFDMCYPNEIKEPGFYEIEYYSDMAIPILPYKNPTNKKLIFPNGNLKGIYWYEEILFFKKNNGIVSKINKAYLFKKKDKVFKSFSETMSSLRNLNNDNNFIFKLITNSLYGRLGLSPSNEKTIILYDNEFIEFEKKESNWIKNYIKINNFYILTYIDEKIKQEVKSNVIYASIITSKARIKLYKGFNSVIKNNGRILYCDTDSIFAAFLKNVDNETHGEIFWDTKKSDTKIKKAQFTLPKMYAVEYFNSEKKTIKIKGIINSNLDLKEFFSLSLNKEKKKFIEKQLKMKDFKFKDIEILKTICFDPQFYNKRIFINNQTETLPLKIE